MRYYEKYSKEHGSIGYGDAFYPCCHEAAGIPQDSDLTIEAVPGVLLIGTGEPLRRANQPLLDLFAAIGIEPEEVKAALEEGEKRSMYVDCK